MSADIHALLLAKSPGYAAFVARQLKDDPDDFLLRVFADWLCGGGVPPSRHFMWSEEDFQDEWEMWHS